MNPVVADPKSPAQNDLKIVKDATCTFCGCVCDDIELKVEGHRILEAKNACVLGKAWFLNHEIADLPACLIEGCPASVEDGVRRAGEILKQARYPVVYGLSDTTCEAQRVAVGIADWIGGSVDTTTSVSHGPSGMAFQGVGEVTASLGEILHRGDLVIFWGGNPAESHPRHFTKYSLMPKGIWTPRGRKDRTCVVVDVRKTKSAKAADVFCRSSLVKISRPFGRCGHWRKGSIWTRSRSSARRHRPVCLAGPDRADEAGPVRRDSFRHGPDDDPRQAPQQ